MTDDTAAYIVEFVLRYRLADKDSPQRTTVTETVAATDVRGAVEHVIEHFGGDCREIRGAWPRGERPDG